MRVVHISSADNRGGAARSAYRLHQMLRELHVESSMFVKNKFSDDESVSVYKPQSSGMHKLKFGLRRRWETGTTGYLSINKTSRLGFAPPTSPSGLDLLAQIPQADIINLHWVCAFFDFRLLPLLVSKCKAVVWRFSDMNPLTGGCFYDNNCGRYTQECGRCPCLNSQNHTDLSFKSLRRKKQLVDSLSDGFLQIVAQSRWMERCTRQSKLFGNTPVIRIPNGIDPNRFKPINSQLARKRLNLPVDAKIVLFIAQSLTNPMKGASYFIDAIYKLIAESEIPILVLVVGAGSFDKIEGGVIKRLTIHDDMELNCAYSASDVFVITSLQDNLPNTVLEAMACGTPVVGFEVGGIPDMVENEQTGFLVPAKDSNALAEKIQTIISNDDLRQHLSIHGRERVVAQFCVEDQAKSYIELYQDLLSVY